ncbi:MAG: hypothetical protein J0H57_26545, partial [Rhodospirillales bacterium]|nr:hypothetical protein [Rhodospirillales bacterium]
MSVASRARLDRRLTELGIGLLSVVLLSWTLVPLYNMVRVALQGKEDVFSSNVFPTAPTLDSFRTAIDESYWLLENFWGQMGNSLYIGLTVAFLTLAIGTLTSFTISRMRIRRG